MKVAVTMMGFLLGMVLCIMAETNAAPSSSLDYDSVRELYEGLLRATHPDWEHRLVRKDNQRNPQLRLRFGRRSVPMPANDDHRVDYFEK